VSCVVFCGVNVKSRSCQESELNVCMIVRSFVDFSCTCLCSC